MKLILVWLMLAIANVTFAADIQKMEITGFQPNEHAVKGNIEQQLKTLAVKISQNPIGSIAVIDVTGCADRTGLSPDNDDIAGKRARDVAEFLRSQFPGVRITDHSNGDDKNFRGVIVAWQLVTAPPAKTTRNNYPLEFICIAGTILFLTGVVLLATKPRRSVTLVTEQPAAFGTAQAQPQIAATALLIAQPASTPVETMVVEVEYDRKIYSLTTFKFKQDGQWVTPFPLQSGNGFITRKNPRDIQSSLLSYLKSTNPMYQAMIEQLIAAGKITVRTL